MAETTHTTSAGTGADPGAGTAADPGAGTAADPGAGTATDPGAGTGADPGAGTAADPGAGTGADPAAGTGADPGAGTGADPGADPVATRPQRADARRNRGRILVAAAETFAERGADAQMDDVARRAGVGVGTVYRHFPTKESLMGELVRLKLDRMQEAAEAGLEVDDPWEAFAGVLRRGAEVMAADAALRDALGRVPEAWEHAAAERERLQAILAQVIRRGQEAGVIRPDFSVDEVPMLMCGVASSMSQHSDWDWRRHLELVLDGIRAR